MGAAAALAFCCALPVPLPAAEVAEAALDGAPGELLAEAAGRDMVVVGEPKALEALEATEVPIADVPEAEAGGAVEAADGLYEVVLKEQSRTMWFTSVEGVGMLVCHVTGRWMNG